MVDGIAEVAGVSLWRANDKVVLSEQRNGPYEKASLALWSSWAVPGAVMVDAGAYTGVYTIAAAKRGAAVTAFEPNAQVFDRLAENGELNRVRFDAWPVALWHRFEALGLRVAPDLSSAGSLTKRAGVRRDIVAAPLDAFNLTGVRAIKMDIERSEANALKGAMKTIRASRPDILTEALDDKAIAGQAEALKPLGYTPERLDWRMYRWKP